MKRFKQILILVLVLALIPAAAYALRAYSISSGAITADGAANAHACLVSNVRISADGTSGAIVWLYDGTSTSGTLKLKYTVASSETSGGDDFSFPIEFGTGVYVKIDGTNANCYVGYTVK